MDALELKIPPPLVALLIGTAMWLVSTAAPSFSLVLPFAPVLALGLGAIGALAAVLGVLSFHRAGTTIDPTKPQKSTALVTTGIYGLSRNPMYLGFLLVLTGWVVFLANVLAVFLIPLFVLYMNRFQIAPEERVLLAKFGADFVAYKAKVRRWV